MVEPTAGPSTLAMAPSIGERAYLRSKGMDETKTRGTDRGQLMLMGTPSWQASASSSPVSPPVTDGNAVRAKSVRKEAKITGSTTTSIPLVFFGTGLSAIS